MPETAEGLAANLKSSRNVIIEITNNTREFCLVKPKVFLESGHCHSPPQPTVRPFKNEACSFTKSTGKTQGAVGVLSYGVLKRGTDEPSDQVVIMFSVPYDMNMYKNWCAAGIYEASRACDESLYKEMYYDKDQKSFKRQEASGSVLLCNGKDLDVMITMSPLGRSIMKVEIWDKLFPAPMEQSSQ